MSRLAPNHPPYLTELLTDTKTGKPMPFQGIRAHADIGAATTCVRVTQRYKNRGKTAVETAYTFPLPQKAVLLSFEAKIGKKVITGRIEPKKEAAEIYEKAVSKGNTAALVEYAGEDLMSAHLGNLPAGEEAEITLTWAEANRWQDGEMRWTLPLCAAPAYGHGKFEPQNEPVTDAGARHDAEISITLAPELATADVSCPSHTLKTVRAADGITLRPARKKIAMDRDVVVKLRAKADIPVVRLATKNDKSAIVASVIPAWTKPAKGGRNIKIVLDCSGSMSGASIETARQTVEAVIGEVGKKDEFNLIRFGSRPEGLFPKQMPGTKENIRLAEACVRHIDADMGGTEIAGALDMAYRSASNSKRPGSVILITDGQVYNVGSVVAAAKESGHRIFCVGVGSCVNHAMLEALAEESGGAAEFVAPGEAVGEAIMRQFRRVRSGAEGGVSITWPGKPEETTAPPSRMFAGDAIHAAALYGKPPAGKVIFSWKGEDGKKHRHQIACETVDDKDLVRIAAGRILAETVRRHDAPLNETEQRKLAKRGEALAMAHDLVSPWTSFVLVLKNKKKVKGDPEFHKVSQMAPAGWNMFSRRAAAPGLVLRASGFASAAISSAAPSAAGAPQISSLSALPAGGMPTMNSWAASPPLSAPGQMSAALSDFDPMGATGDDFEDIDERNIAPFLAAVDTAIANGEGIHTLKKVMAMGGPHQIVDAISKLMREGIPESAAVSKILGELAARWPSLFSMAGRMLLSQAA